MSLATNISNCKKGKREAQKWLFDVYAKVFFKLSKRYVLNVVDAEDCVLEAFMKIFEGLKTFEYQSDGQTEAWMKRIVVNQSLKHLRKQNTLFIVQLPHEEYAEEANNEIDEAISATELLTCIAQLPDGYRTIFNMYEIEGYSHQEIAQTLNITESTSRSQLFKAKRILQEKLKKGLTKF